MARSIRLVFRMQRFEIVAMLIFVVALVAAALYVAWELDSVGFGPCFLAMDAPPAGCEALGRRFFDLQMDHAQPVFSFLGILPYAAGIFIGAPVIARELERGTARLAWSVAPSRIRWYAWRVVPVIIFAVAIAFVAGWAADRLVAARTPGIDLANSFDTYGERGVLVAVTAFVMVAGAIGLGSVIGRVLPTVILALILGYFGIIGVQKLHADFTAREAVVVEESELRPADLYVDQFFRLPDGRLVGWQELEAIDPEAFQNEQGPQYPIVSLVIPGERYREVETRQALLLGSIGVAMLVGAGVIVARRRPG